jgi:hypothetical protein
MDGSKLPQLWDKKGKEIKVEDVVIAAENMGGHLTFGRRYKVLGLRYEEKRIVITDDRGLEGWYNAKRFVVLRNEKAMSREHAVKFVSDFITRIDTDDNAGTAAPILHVLQEHQETITEDTSDRSRTAYTSYHLDYEIYDTEDEARDALAEIGSSEDPDEIGVREEWVDRNWFFTREGAERHLALNSYNYSKTRIYTKHAFRNPEMEELFAALRGILLDTKGQTE